MKSLSGNYTSRALACQALRLEGQHPPASQAAIAGCCEYSVWSRSRMEAFSVYRVSGRASSGRFALTTRQSRPGIASGGRDQSSLRWCGGYQSLAVTPEAHWLNAMDVAAFVGVTLSPCSGLRLQGFSGKLLWNRCHIAEETMR